MRTNEFVNTHQRSLHSWRTPLLSRACSLFPLPGRGERKWDTGQGNKKQEGEKKTARENTEISTAYNITRPFPHHLMMTQEDRDWCQRIIIYRPGLHCNRRMNKGVLKNGMNDTRTKYTFHGAHIYATGKGWHWLHFNPIKIDFPLFTTLEENIKYV